MAFGALPGIEVEAGAALTSLNRITTLLDRAEPQVRRRFLELVDAAANLNDLERITELLEQGRVQEALAATEEIGPGLSTALEEAYRAAGLSAAEVLREVAPTLLDFNSLNARSVASLQDNRLRLVREFNSQQSLAAQEMLSDALTRGLAPVEQARALKQSIGLTQRQAQAVTNYRMLLDARSPQALTRELRDKRFDPTIRRAIRTGVPLTQAQIDRMVDRYHDKYVQFRANTIARTETLRAVNEGEEELWNQAIDEGILTPDQITKRWQTARDERVRGSHRFMNNQRVGFDERFISGLGNQLRFPGDPRAPGSDTIQCRCVVVRDIKGRARR